MYDCQYLNVDVVKISRIQVNDKVAPDLHWAWCHDWRCWDAKLFSFVHVVGVSFDLFQYLCYQPPC